MLNAGLGKRFPVNCFQQLKEIKRTHSLKLIRSIANHASSTFSGDSLRFQLFVFDNWYAWLRHKWFVCIYLLQRGTFSSEGFAKQLHFRLTSTVDCVIDGTVASYPKELTQVMLKPGGGEFVWIDLVYIFLPDVGWSTSLHRRPGQAKACEKARVQSPFEWDIGYPNQWCPLFASVSRMFIYIIYHVFIHFTPAFFNLIPVGPAFWSRSPGPQFILSSSCSPGDWIFPNRFVAKVIPIWRPPVSDILRDKVIRIVGC